MEQISYVSRCALSRKQHSFYATVKYRRLWLYSRQGITRQQNDRSPEKPTARNLLKRSEWLIHPSLSLSRCFVHVKTLMVSILVFFFPWSPYKTLRTKYETDVWMMYGWMDGSSKCYQRMCSIGLQMMLRILSKNYNICMYVFLMWERAQPRGIGVCLDK